MVDDGQYFTINRARQYGKTTILQVLKEFLQEDYLVDILDFQMISYADFENEQSFTAAFSRELLEETEGIPDQIRDRLAGFADRLVEHATLSLLFQCLTAWCKGSGKRIVLMIDEVDSAVNNQVFLDFLAQLRGGYIRRDRTKTFQSVILAGVYDVKNIRQKIRPEDGHKTNSPWNIAADFRVDMSFSAADISGMLDLYEKDCYTGMKIREMSELIYDYTSGYPYLVSCICKLMDERVAGSSGFPDRSCAWTKEVAKVDNQVVIANRIFETLLYDLFLTSPAMQQQELYDAALKDRGQFVRDGHLDMKRILERFVVHFTDLYGD